MKIFILLREGLWFYGFKVFYNVKHPIFAPLKMVRRIATLFKSGERVEVPVKNIPPKTIPKKIWIYWAQGWESAPPLVKLCRDSWMKRNPGWSVVLLSKENLPQYLSLDFLAGKDVPHAAYSDIVRVHLLEKYGGVWADATVFCSIPLDAWLPPLMQGGFFAFEKSKTTIASWFIASESENFLVKKWMEYVDSYWRFARMPGRYFWFHYLFEYLLVLNSEAKAVWRRTPRVNSDGPYAVQRCLKRGSKKDDECASMLFESSSPVHKLDWKMEIEEIFLQSLKSHLSKAI